MATLKTETQERIKAVVAATVDEWASSAGFVRTPSVHPHFRDWLLRRDGVLWTIGTQRDKFNTRDRCRFTVNFGLGVDGAGVILGRDDSPMADILLLGRLAMLAAEEDRWWTIEPRGWLARLRGGGAAQHDGRMIEEIRSLIQGASRH